MKKKNLDGDLQCQCCGAYGPDVYTDEDGFTMCERCHKGECYCDMEYGDPWGDKKESGA